MGAPLIERLAESGVQHHCRGGGGRGAQPGGVTGPGGALVYEATPLGAGALPRAAWLVVSLVALYYFKANMVGWIGVSTVVGLLYYRLVASAHLLR